MSTRAESPRKKALAALYLAARYYAAFTLLLYGFAKLMGAQFTVLDSQLAKPLGDVSGFWLTWYYFGYSALYSSLIAWVQIGGAWLLCFQRTALAGALVLLPILLNIVGIDLWIIHFPASDAALRRAFYVLAALLVVLAFHAPDVYRFLATRRDDLRLLSGRRRWVVVFPAVAVLGMTAYQAHEAYWIANTNNRAPTPIDGAWHVVAATPGLPHAPEWIYFEYNRAHMAVFRFSDGSIEAHDFRVDQSTHRLEIAKTWLQPGSDILSGTWSRDGDTLQVSGVWDKTAAVKLTLKRKQMKVRDHA